MTDDLAQFLRDRVAEDEQAANAVPPGPWRWVDIDDDGGERVDLIGSDGETVLGSQDTSGYHSWVWRRDGVDDYLAIVNPQRVLAEVDAKQRIIDGHAADGQGCQVCCDAGLDEDFGEAGGYLNRSALPSPCPTLRLLALSYRDHPKYRAEWAPEG